MGRSHHKHRPVEVVRQLSETTRRAGSQYVRCKCNKKLLIGRVPLHELGKGDLYAQCSTCGATVRILRGTNGTHGNG